MQLRCCTGSGAPSVLGPGAATGGLLPELPLEGLELVSRTSSSTLGTSVQGALAERLYAGVLLYRAGLIRDRRWFSLVISGWAGAAAKSSNAF